MSRTVTPGVADPPDEAGESVALLRVHAGRRLVEQEQLGLGRQRARDLEPALLAVRQVLRELVGLVRKPHEPEPDERLVDRVLLLALERGGAQDRARAGRPSSGCAARP